VPAIVTPARVGTPHAERLARVPVWRERLDRPPAALDSSEIPRNGDRGVSRAMIE